MKIAVKQIGLENWSSRIGRLLAEPLLVAGMVVFWAIALAVTALAVVLEAVVESVVACLRAPAAAGSRMTRSAA